MIITSLPYQFLTTKPQRRLISTDHPEWLYILPNVDIPGASLVATCYWQSGGNITYTLISADELDLNGGEVRYFDISYAKRNYANLDPAKTIAYIRIQINAAAIDSGEKDYIDLVPYTPVGDDITAIYYRNSQGGMDSLICAGDVQEAIEIDGLQVATPLEAVYDTQAAQYSWVDPSYRTDISVHTGAKSTRELKALKDLMLIKSAFEYREADGVLFTKDIIPEQLSVSMPSSRTNIKKLSFIYRYAVSQKAIDRAL